LLFLWLVVAVQLGNCNLFALVVQIVSLPVVSARFC
jgi:hypothetical protein